MSVCVLSVVILLFEWLHLLLGVEFGNTDTVDRSGMVEIVGNRSDFVAIRSENEWTGQKTNSGLRAVRWVEPGIFCGLFYPLGCGYRAARLTAWLDAGIFSWLGFDFGLVARRGLNMARVWLSRSLPLGAWDARGQTVQNIQVARVGYLRLWSSWYLNQWVRMDELYTLEWSKLVFDNFENSDISQNTSVFWRTELWYQLVVGETTGGGFETLGGDKTHYFISRNK